MNLAPFLVALETTDPVRRPIVAGYMARELRASVQTSRLGKNMAYD